MPDPSFQVRLADEADRYPLAELFAAIAEERDGIATEPPVDLNARAAGWVLEWTYVATADAAIVGSVHLEPSRFGFCEVALVVAGEWRGKGVGSALLATAIDRAREDGSLHKLTLSVFAHNDVAIGLYRRAGFIEEGRRNKHYRRASGDLWDSIEMGLLL